MEPATENQGKCDQLGFSYPIGEEQEPVRKSRRTGIADMSGEDFEVGIATLLFIRAKFRTCEFSLDTNVEGAGAFDDLIFSYNDEHSNNHTVFLQLKYRKNKPVTHLQLFSKCGNFSLLKYFDSFCQIQKQFPISEHCKYIIYTNANIEQELMNRTDVTDEIDKLVSSGGAQERIICFRNGDKEYEAFNKYLIPYKDALLQSSSKSLELNMIKDDLRSSFSELDHCKRLLRDMNNESTGSLIDQQLTKELDELVWESFMNKSYLISGQASDENLDELIKQSLVEFVGTEKIFLKLKSEMTQWWKKGDYSLSHKYAPFWDSIMKDQISDLVAPITNKLSAISKIKFLKTGDMSEKIIHIIKTKVSTKRMIHIKTKGCTELSSLRVSQLLTDEGFILIDSNTFLSRTDEVLAIWKFGSWCRVLVVEGTFNESAFERVKEILKDSPEKRLILVSKESDNFVTKLSTGKLFDIEIQNENFSLDQLEEESQNKILNCEVDLQGSLVKLRNMADKSTLIDVLDADLVLQLSSEQQRVTIGKKIPDNDPCYIKRTLYRTEYINTDIFNDRSLKLAISGLSKKDLQHLIPHGETVKQFNKSINLEKTSSCYFMIKGYEDFSLLSKYCNNIHWIHWSNKKFIWKLSNGNLYSILNYLENDKVTYNKVETFLELSQQLVLVIADPGMGKSTELRYLALHTKKNQPETWVVRINLNDYTEDLDHEHFNVIDLLMKAGEFKTEFQKKLFNYQLSIGGNVIVLFDSFDEISPKYADNVIVMLKDLLKYKIKKLWLTSRAIMRVKLENELNLLPFYFFPLTENEQVHYLTKLWQPSVGNSLKYLDKFVTKLLNISKESLNDVFLIFTGIPLQMKLFAEVFKDHLLHYCKTGRMNLPQRFDLLNLYRMFIDKKWQTVYCDKTDMNMSKVLIEEFCKQMRSDFEKNIMHCALVTLLDDDIKNLHNYNEIIQVNNKFIERFQAGTEEPGLVTDVQNNKAVFLHQTFAEYFCAVWFTVHYSTNLKMFAVLYTAPNFQIFRNFFDRIMANKFDLHLSVLNYDIDRVKILLSKDNYDINKLDNGGRTALHLGISNFRNIHILDKLKFYVILLDLVRVLLEHGSETDVKDNILHLSPLQLAEQIGAWEAIDLLLKHSADSGDLVLIPKNIKSESFVQYVMLVSTIQGLQNLVDFMLKCGVSIGYRFNNKETMLHIAVLGKQMNFIQFLVEHKIEINACNENNETALMYAAITGSVKILKYLIKNKASPYCKNTEGSGILHYAMFSDSADCVKFLLECGVNVDCRNMEHQTPLMWAVTSSSVDITRLLVKQGAGVKAADKNGNSVLHFSVSTESDLEHIKYLLVCGVDINYINKKGETPLMKAVGIEESRTQNLIFKLKKNLYGIYVSMKTELLLSQQYDTKFWENINNNLITEISKRSFDVGQYKIQEKTNNQALNTNITKQVASHIPYQFFFNMPIVFSKSIISSVPNVLRMPTGLMKLQVDTQYNKDKTLTYTGKAIPLRETCRVAELLMKRGAKLDISDHCGNTVLHHAVQSSSLQCVECLLNQELDINCRNKNDKMPLSLALDIRQIHIADLLIKKGANPNAMCYEGRTTLHIAAYFNRLDIVKYILDHGLDINCRTLKDETPLIAAAAGTHLETLKFLIKKRAKLESKDESCNTALHWAVFKGSVDVTKHLLTHRLAVDCKNKVGRTPFILAGFMGVLEIAKLLVKHGAQVKIEDERGNTALHFAVSGAHDNIEYVNFLLDTGLDVDCNNKGNQTPLMMAANNGTLQIVELLIKKGARLKAKYENGYTVLHFAACGSIYVTNFLLEHGLDVDCKSKRNETPLMLAAFRGNLQIVQLLIKQGANVENKDKHGNTALHVAVSASHNIECVQFLLKCGFNVDCKNKEGQTPLMLAALGGHLQIVQLLIQQGAKLQIADEKGNSALHLAIYAGKHECVEFLLQNQKMKT